MIDIDSSIMRGVRAHHADGKSKIDGWHNDLHQSIEGGLNRLGGGGGGDIVKQARSIVEDATQLKISAELLDTNGDDHLDAVKRKVNKSLPANNKFVLSDGRVE